MRKLSSKSQLSLIRGLKLAHIEPVFPIRKDRKVKDLWLVDSHGKYGSRDCALLGGACAVKAVLD
jgi:hypothetical protein